MPRDHRTDAKMSIGTPAPSFTAERGPYLASIHAYSRIDGMPPAEADFQEVVELEAPSAARAR